MRRIGVPLAVACFLAAWPATAGACERRPGAPRFVASAKPRAVVVCDRARGRRRVIRRVAAPLRIREALVVGPRVAWVEGPRGGPDALLARHLIRPGAPRELDRGFIELVEAAGATTLDWIGDGAFRSADLAPPPLRAGCPLRSGARTVAEGQGVQVTFAWHARGTERERLVWRACRLGSGRDRVVLVESGGMTSGTVVRVAGTGEGVVAFVLESYDKYNGCNREHVVSVDADTGATLRRGADDWCGAGAAPPERTPAAVTATGAVAWVQDGALRAVTASGAVEVLDWGAIGDLRAVADLLRWTNKGEPHEARP
ncbi:MAG TPA: hypothetical protein VF587_16825 [Solirubrobacteraceae bacterium]